MKSIEDQILQLLNKIRINLQDHEDADKENRCSYYCTGDALDDVKQAIQLLEIPQKEIEK